MKDSCPRVLRLTLSREDAYQRLVTLSCQHPVVALLDDGFWLWCRRDVFARVPLVWVDPGLVDVICQQRHFPDPAGPQLLPLRLSRNRTSVTLGFAPIAVIVLRENAEPFTVDQAVARFNRIDTQAREIHVWTLRSE